MNTSSVRKSPTITNVDLLDNKYQVEQLLGKGAVYRATHLGTKRPVAVKVIHPQLSAHDQFVARFRRIPGLIAALVFGLYAPVAIMEQHGVRGTLRRNRTLSRRAWGTVLVITLVQVALPVLIWERR